MPHHLTGSWLFHWVHAPAIIPGHSGTLLAVQAGYEGVLKRMLMLLGSGGCHQRLCQLVTRILQQAQSRLPVSALETKGSASYTAVMRGPPRRCNFWADPGEGLRQRILNDMVVQWHE
ncbi:hypothetical protein H1C71_008298 [Ictidomys tridecemlineatus]|nr:hypothetical protein H1C71_008298 [Ictidomys tridecemlineatus]